MAKGKTPAGTIGKRHSAKDVRSYRLVEKAFEECSLPVLEKLDAFPRFVSKRSMTRFVGRYEMYRKILNIPGAVIECGVYNGAGLFTWAQLATIFEPTNYSRKIIGFDTFSGYPEIAEEDRNSVRTPRKGLLKGESKSAFSSSVKKYGCERHLSHIPNIELIKGDVCKTAPRYLKNNSHLMVSLLHLNFDLYEPTAAALETFVPRMAKGSLICFGYLNCPNAAGETLALLKKLDVKRRKIERLPFDPWLTYITV